VAVTNSTSSPQAAVLAVLAGGCGSLSLSTREVRDGINTDRTTPLVNEALVALHHRGVVVRLSDGHHVYWRLVAR
jgi:hypothetical protein